jgi:thiol-disulfide isomerase/thioredoxin
MIQSTLVLALALMTVPQDSPSQALKNPEAKIVEYLQANVKPGEPVVVSTLFNEVFTTAPERKALNRLFNTFFKIPLFVVQAQKATGRPPSLQQISEQFAFMVPGTADVILRVMESDPRMPKFLERDPKTGEILKADVLKITTHPRFGKILERTITGWEGNPAPAFAVKAYDGSDLSTAAMAGKPFLLYFWFTNCPPCVTTSPLLVELDKVYGSKGFTIVGLNADKALELDYTDEVRAAYADKLSIKFTLAHANAEALTAYGGVSVFPTLFFVDAAGVVVKHFVNGQVKTVLEDAVKLALK